MEVKDHVRGERVHFHPVGISNKNETTDKNWPLLTFNSIKKTYGHSQVCYFFNKDQICFH